MTDMQNMNEQQLREYDPPWPKTEDELLAQIRALVNREHDYGTCVYAMSIAAMSTFNYMSHAVGGATGFQASCADMDFMRRSRNLKHGFRILDYGKLLYPQYCVDEQFPGWSTAIDDNIERLGPAAAALLAETPYADDRVVDHWKMLVSRAETRR